MARQFVADFMLPLVRGGALRIGRPLGAGALARLEAALARADVPRGAAELRELGEARRAVAARYLPGTAPPALDAVSIRLGAALYNLLALGHPDLAGPGLTRRQERIAEAALAFADVGAPASACEAVGRHSLLARWPEIVRVDRTVRFWLGRQKFVGRTPPRRITALPALRRVTVERTSRNWLRDIGIPASAQRAFVALNAASPLGEALDPLRLDPAIAWGRILPVLRFPALARVVAGSAVELGVDRAGDAMAAALYRFAGIHDGPIGVAASSDAVRFALQFLAHLVWLDVLFGPRAGARHVEAGAAAVGLELAVVLAAAARANAALVWPPDVPADSDLGRGFRDRLAALAVAAESAAPSRRVAAQSIAALAAPHAAEPLAL
jgi:hypothetical protein